MTRETTAAAVPAWQPPCTMHRTFIFAVIVEALPLEEAPIIPFVHTARVYLIHPSVKGWMPTLMGLARYQRVALEETR